MSDIAGIGQIIGAGADLIGHGMNFDAQMKNLDYQKNLQQQIFQREDNSVQRRVADLRSAGLSRVLAAGQGAQAGAVVSTQAPQLNLNMQDKMLKLFENQKMALDLGKQKADITKTEEEARLAKIVADNAEYGIKNTRMGMDVEFGKRQIEEFFQLLTKDYFGQHGQKERSYVWNSWDPKVQSFQESLKAKFDKVIADLQHTKVSTSGQITHNKIMEQMQKNYEDLGLSHEMVGQITDLAHTILNGAQSFGKKVFNIIRLPMGGR